MFGMGTGELNVKQLSADGSSSSRIWSESGDMGNQWKRGLVTIAFDVPFKVSHNKFLSSDKVSFRDNHIIFLLNARKESSLFYGFYKLM